MRCIYKIEINDRYYLGSTTNFDNRKRLHLVKLRKNYHPNKFLQNLYNKYGEYSFRFSIIEEIDDGIDPLNVEQIYLDEHFGHENCVNLSPVTGGGFYYKRTPESITKCLDTRLKNGNWFSGARYPKEAIAANTGSKRSEEFCNSMSNTKKELYKNSPDRLEDFKKVAAKGRLNRWERDKKPFILYRNGLVVGRFDFQTEVFSQGLMSNVSINQLCVGKKKSVKGYTLEFIDIITK
jgi:hypothetical protein